MRSTRPLSRGAAGPAPGRVSSPSCERGPSGRVLSSVSAECGAFDDACTTMNAVSSSLSGSHVLGTPAGGISPRGKSARVQSSTRPPTFSTGVGGALHAPACSPSLRGEADCSVFRVAATSLTTTSSSSSREHASNSARCLQNRCGVRPCNVVGTVGSYPVKLNHPSSNIIVIR